MSSTHSEFDPMTDLVAEISGTSFRMARVVRDALSQRGGLIEPVYAKGAGRRWTARAAANFLTARFCGLPVRNAGECVPEINALPRNIKAAMRYDEDGVAAGLEFTKGENFGEGFEGLLRDFQAGRFEHFRSMAPTPKFPPSMREAHVSVKFEGARDGGIPTATISLMHMPTTTAVVLHYGPHHVRTDEFWIARTLLGTIAPGGPPSLFERVAALLEPLPN